MKRLFLALAAAAALWTAACNGGSTVTPPPPVGKYSVSSLKGQYAFVTNGEVFTSTSQNLLARIGTFTADGAGNITGGVEDVNEAGSTSLALQISGGSYTVNADGRGTLTLSIPSNGVTSSINFGIVLNSTNDGLMIDETSNSNQASTGSGNFVKQNSGSFSVSGIAGPYVFDFSGIDANGNPDSFMGEFTANNGAFNPGFFDENDFGTFANGAFTGTAAQDPLNVSTLSSFGRGIALIAGQNYVFYIVDSTRVRFISTNGGMLSGDAVAQDNTVPTQVSSLNSGFAFIVAGSSGSGGITRVGRFTAKGATVTNVLQDTNDGGKFILTDTTTTASISLDAANPGRGTFTFTDKNFPSAPSTYIFYLSSATQGVIQEQTANNGGAVDVADGTIAAQTGSPFSSSNISGTYALNWSGLSFQQGGSIEDEEDLLAQLTISSLALNGTSDIFQFTAGVPQTDLASGGSITISSSDGTSSDGKRNTMSVIYNKSSGSTVNCVIYFVSPQLAFFANKDNQGTTRIIAGVLKVQQ